MTIFSVYRTAEGVSQMMKKSPTQVVARPNKTIETMNTLTVMSTHLVAYVIKVWLHDYQSQPTQAFGF
jgi:hypothetical protein